MIGDLMKLKAELENGNADTRADLRAIEQLEKKALSLELIQQICKNVEHLKIMDQLNGTNKAGEFFERIRERDFAAIVFYHSDDTKRLQSIFEQTKTIK